MKALLKQHGVIFILLSMLTGLMGAFVNPLMSLFIIEGLQTPPVYLGVYMVAVTITGLIISQWLGGMADKGTSARKLFMVAVSGMVCALVTFANATAFWQVLLAGVLFLAMGNAAIPQMMTVARQWAGRQQNIDITSFNSRLRAAISFAWVGGPPLGYLLASGGEFSRSFYFAAACALVALIFAFKFIPDYSAKKSQHSSEPAAAASLSFWLLGLAIMLGSTGNIMYSSALPLYSITELGFAEHTPGLFMGVVALLEIPIMLYAAKLAKRYSKVSMLVVAFCCAIVFYLGVFFATQVWHLIALQVLNGLFYGIFAGIGLTVLQDQLPERIGFTSAFYTNAIKLGVMCGAGATGVIAQFHSFRFASLGSMLAVSLALGCLILFSYVKRKEQQPSLIQSPFVAVTKNT
ncbi:MULTISPECIES: sugar efflux transporter [unclassified Pseudoalteromonas]|uniref:sugar efflux transporter n=1 Tax=unclassified Pseudoalteromonas TaxID=194690 RepID=UPI00201E7067|nr:MULTISPECIES: sugar efflux transporter [unclassified Pseudoalteromonas]